MSNAKLKMRVGEHEFEAEGSAEDIKGQFEAFKELIEQLHKPSITNEIQIFTAPELDKIFKVDGRVVSLILFPTQDTDAVLLILYGQKHYRNNSSVTGGEIVDGLNIDSSRTRKAIAALLFDEQITVEGEHRAKRYSLTKTGVGRAEQVIHTLLNPPF
jgi:hypothetical protein